MRPNPSSISGQALGVLSDASFRQLVNAAFKEYHSTLALSRSPLANSALITPTLVKDSQSPTAEERGRGMRLLLQWAASSLAPTVSEFPLGTYRPLDDPTWRDPLWWRYNILRHRYLEPLHPDDFVGEGRYTETLIALTGIPSTDAFFDERNRAIREVTQFLRQQFITEEGSAELQRLAIDEAMQPLLAQKGALTLLGASAIFDDIFPRDLLIQIAQRAGYLGDLQPLNYLITNRFLLTDDAGLDLWLSPALRTYLTRQPLEGRPRLHREAASYFAEQANYLLAAKHHLYGGQSERAAELLLSASEELTYELMSAELIHLLRQFSEEKLSPDRWREVQILLADLYRQSGQYEEAIAACRQALKVTSEPTKQAQIYRRMGKLYEKHNLIHALGYYDQAYDRLSATDPELPNLLKDRAWLYIMRKEWAAAENDLTLALDKLDPPNRSLEADIYDALASIERRRERYPEAVRHAQKALTLREELGNLPRIADSFNNLGLLYRKTGDSPNAISASTEALTIYKKIGSQEAIAGTYLNIGSGYYVQGELALAVENYQHCLALSAEHQLLSTEASARHNLAEALDEMGFAEEAKVHWLKGFQLSESMAFVEALDDFVALRKERPTFQTIPLSRSEVKSGSLVTASLDSAYPDSFSLQPQLDPAHAEIMAQINEILQLHGRLTPKHLMDFAHVSKATATRRLAELVEAGLLKQMGKGRGTHYVLPTEPGPVTGTFSAQVPVESGAAPPDSALCLAKLIQERRWLQEEWHIRTLGLLDQPEAVYATLIAAFALQPDLANFFHLEEKLTELLDCSVRLLPDFAYGGQETRPTDSIQWAW